MKISKRIVIPAIILGLAVFGYIKFTAKQTQEPQYQTATAERGSLVVSISSSGQVSNANSGSIGTQASGVVTKIYVSNGSYVKQGDPIADLELDQSARQNYSQALASYQSAKNSLDNAQQNYYALQADLFAKNKTFTDLAKNSTYTNGDGSPNLSNRDLPEFIVAHDNWLASEAKYKSQQNVVSQAQTSLNSAWLSYLESSPTIYAPISGTVTGLALQEGSVLTQQTGSTGTITSQKVASIKTNAPPTISINLTEVDVPKIKIGNKATITIDAFPDKTYTGQVLSIDTVGTVSSGVTTYPTVIKFDTDVEGILSNMSAQANIITASKNDVLLVPSSAVQSENGQNYVRIMKNGQVQQQPVEVGLSSSTQTEITSGLSEGDSIITSITTSSITQSSTTQSPFSAFGGTRGGFGGGGTNVRIAR